jgi:hypothetical protein
MYPVVFVLFAHSLAFAARTLCRVPSGEPERQAPKLLRSRGGGALIGSKRTCVCVSHCRSPLCRSTCSTFATATRCTSKANPCPAALTMPSRRSVLSLRYHIFFPKMCFVYALCVICISCLQEACEELQFDDPYTNKTHYSTRFSLPIYPNNKFNTQ